MRIYFIEADRPRLPFRTVQKPAKKGDDGGEEALEGNGKGAADGDGDEGADGSSGKSKAAASKKQKASGFVEPIDDYPGRD